MDFASINYLAVVVAALASFILGMVWYSPVLFYRSWQKELGFSNEELEGANMVVIFGTAFLLMLLMAFGIALLLSMRSRAEVTWIFGLHHGLIIGVLFSATTLGINYLYQRRSFKLWAIDAFYQILFLAISGIIIGAW